MIRPGMAKRKRSEHYVNNKEFLAALIKYREDKEIAEMKGLPKIIERSGYSEVFDDNNTLDGSNYSDYNSIKDAVHSKLRY